MHPNIRVKKLVPHAKIPTYAHPGDAGLDFFAAEKTTVLPGERTIVKTGLSIAIPDGYVGLFWDKSGVSIKSGIKTLGGVIDAGYRGEIMIGVVNISKDTFVFEVGHKVAQLLVQKIEHAVLVEDTDIGSTTRGIHGFGSTGI